jgi:isoquinoline 1-oxidoreductase subunit beta
MITITHQPIWRLIMIHHRPRASDVPRFQRCHLTRGAACRGGLVLSLRLPLPRHDTGPIENAARNASLHVGGDGEVLLTLPYLGTGRDISTSISALVAGQLDVAPGRIHFKHAPTGEMLEAEAIDYSQAIRAAWKLLSEAGATARAMLIAAAAERWGVNARSCHTCDGEVIHTSTWRKIGYGELAIEAAFRPIPSGVALKPPQAGVRMA